MLCAQAPSHPVEWVFGKVRCQGRELAERSINLERSPHSKPSMLRILAQALTPREVAAILEMMSEHRLSRAEALKNPVKSPHMVLAEDGSWKSGPLAELVRAVVDGRLLPYMRSVLDCSNLQVAQVLLRRYGKDGCRSFQVHADHVAFGTAVADLTPLQGSGLFVCSQGRSSGLEDEAFFVPFEAGDVAVHGWEVWHGIRLKPGHDRVSLIVWARPAQDVAAGSCSWYWAPELRNDLRAGYHMGIEAWRQRLLGRTKAALLQVALNEGNARRLRAKLQALGGVKQAESWYLKCVAAASRNRLADSKLATKLQGQAEAEAAGSSLQQMREVMRGTNAPGANPTEMRRAFQRGWEDAQAELADTGLQRLQPLQHVAPRAMDLAAGGRSGAYAAGLLRSAGLVVFEQPADSLEEALLHGALADFRRYFGVIQRELARQGVATQRPFEFNEVCSRLSQRFDVRGFEDPALRTAFCLETMPWKQLVRDALGITAKEPLRYYWGIPTLTT